MSLTHKCTLVPARFFEEEDARCILSSLFTLSAAETVSFRAVPRLDAVLVYAAEDGQEPVLEGMIDRLPACKEYNKILFHRADGYVDLVICQGERLLLANSYPAPDFTTAEYYLFLAMKSLQLNPEVSTVSVLSGLTEAEEMSLYRYFKSVESL